MPGDRRALSRHGQLLAAVRQYASKIIFNSVSQLERFLLEQHRNALLDLLDRNTSVNRQVFHKAREACLAAAIPEARLAHREQQIKQRLQEIRNPTNPTPELVEQWR